LGLEHRGRRLAAAFLVRDAKPKAAEKSWRRTLREDERAAASAVAVVGQTMPIEDANGAPVSGNCGNTAMAAVLRRAGIGDAAPVALAAVFSS
jgi:hypothetical protein